MARAALTVDETLPGTSMALRDTDHLLDIVRRARAGFRTYPTAPSENQKKLHRLCEDLSRQGKLRGRDAGSAWYWEAVA